MTMAFPAALWFLAGLPVLVLLYLLKVRHRLRVVPTLFLWDAMTREDRPRALLRRLRQWISLLLHLLIYTLLALALARPAPDKFLAGDSVTVLVFDCRLPMQAGNRFELAREQAERVVRESGGRHRMAVVRAGRVPRVLGPLGSDKRTLLDVVHDIRPSDEGGSIPAAVDVAQQMLTLSGTHNGRILVISGPPAPKDSAAPAQGVEWIVCGDPAPNLALTRMAARRLPGSPQTQEIQLDVANFGDAPREAALEWFHEGSLFNAQTVRLEAGEIKSLFQSASPGPAPAQGARWEVRLRDTGDDLTADDVAFAVMPPPPHLRVLLVSEGNRFLESALASDEELSFEQLSPAAFRQEIASGMDAVILDDWLPPNFDASVPPPGNWMLFGRTSFETPDVHPGSPPLDWLAWHPVLRMVDLDTANLVRVRSQHPPTGSGPWNWQVLARMPDTALIVAGELRSEDASRQRLLALAFPADGSDLPLRIGFPVLISNSVRWLAGLPVHEVRTLAAGDPLRPGPGESWSDASPTNTPDRNGFHRILGSGGGRIAAINTEDAGVSDLRGGGTVSTSAPSARWKAGWPPWLWCAVLAFVLFSAEWWWFHRRITE